MGIPDASSFAPALRLVDLSRRSRLSALRVWRSIAVWLPARNRIRGPSLFVSTWSLVVWVSDGIGRGDEGDRVILPG